ncbi:MAG: site-2 protease family protein [Infirmifilum sp.]|uniref:PDZ domain-containing protein n=1 Tax=Infirmifilum uzonense TaxID=1550241 RepID=A0A0F7FIS8_9CREN|nr:site-2 protease family protein [Infirmifilum uzonense]AKG38744.1 hypothetical protein MA03_04915 [Infirmifilum uzonense]
MASSQILVSINNAVYLGAILFIYAGIIIVQRLKPQALEKLGISLEGAVILLKTRRLNTIIVSFAGRHPKLIRLLGDVSTIIGIGLMIFGLFYFHANLVSFFIRPEAASPVAPIIPGVTLGLDALPYFLIAVFLTIVPHELAHAFAASAEGLPLKSTGLFLALVFPGGFAEIDEEKLGSASLRAKLRVLSSGSSANLASFIVFALLTSLLIQPTGVLIASTIPGYPAQGILEPNDVVIAVNGVPTNTLQDFTRVMETTKPGEAVLLTVKRGNEIKSIEVILAPRPGNTSRGFLGVQIQQAVNNPLLYNVLYWCLVLTSSVAIINMLPAIPLDGGRILQALLEKMFSAEKAKKLAFSITIYTALIVVLNIAFSTNFYGLVPFP